MFYPVTVADAVILSDGMNLNDKFRYLPGKNLLINGGLQVWQRGTTFPKQTDDSLHFDIATGSYTADRWYITCNTTAGTSPVTVTRDGGMKFTFQSAGTATIIYILDDDDYAFLNGKLVTLSYSEGGIIRTVSYEIGANSGLSKARYAVELEINGFAYGDTTTIEWFKLELGGEATPFIQENYTDELLRCARYYYRPKGIGYTLPWDATYSGSDHTLAVIAPFVVPMRAVNSVTVFEPYLASIKTSTSYVYSDEGWGQPGHCWTMGFTDRVTVSNVNSWKAVSNIVNTLNGMESFVIAGNPVNSNKNLAYFFRYEASGEIYPAQV